MKYAICFDFPEGGDPVFAADADGSPGWTFSLESARRFSSWAAADLFLKNAYGKTAKYGTVVEVES